jgi:hypothetical protein
MKVGGGAWSGLGDVEGQTGDPGTSSEPRIFSGGLAAVGGNLHVVQITTSGSFPGPNHLMHAVRSSSGFWTRFNDVAAGAPGGLPSGGFFNVSLSRNRN